VSPLPTVLIPGYFASAREYLSLAHDLEQLGVATTVVPLGYRSWLPTLGGKPVTPVLEIIAQTITETCARYGTTQVNLVGHSAGGWIARLLLGEQDYMGRVWGRFAQVHTLVTLGTPHLSQERFTRTNMDFVNTSYPGAFQQGVRYVCVAGRAVSGLDDWFARQSYRLTCGQADCWGDGITPIAAAHLRGAENLVLEGVWHSPRRQRQWYGSPAVLGQWVGYLDCTL